MSSLKNQFTVRDSLVILFFMIVYGERKVSLYFYLPLPLYTSFMKRFGEKII